jgi:transcriptional regulator with XRE-family HTH domain
VPIILSLSKDERAGMSQQYISDLERGLCNPTIVTLYELATALGVGPVELVKPGEGRAVTTGSFAVHHAAD